MHASVASYRPARVNYCIDNKLYDYWFLKFMPFMITYPIMLVLFMQFHGYSIRVAISVFSLIFDCSIREHFYSTKLIISQPESI